MMYSSDSSEVRGSREVKVHVNKAGPPPSDQGIQARPVYSTNGDLLGEVPSQ